MGSRFVLVFLCIVRSPQVARVSWMVIMFVCAWSARVFALMVTWEWSCGRGGVSLGCPPPSRLSVVGFCEMDVVFG